MAKHCDVCNQDYADDLPACPHCAAAKHPPSDSVIDLGQGPRVAPATGDAAGVEPASISGESFVQWAELVEEPGPDEIKIDSPSDADLLAQGSSEPAKPEGENIPASSSGERVGELRAEEAPSSLARGGKGEVIDLTHSPPQPAQPAFDSAVDLGAASVEGGSGAVLREVPPSDSQVYEAELASDASKVEMVEEPDAEVVEEVVAADEAGAGREPAAEAVEASADPSRPEAELAEEVALDAEVVDEHSSAVDLGAPPPPKEPEALSSISPEEIVDVPEGSGIDLEGLPVPASSGSDSGISSGPRSPSESSVDLGSQEDVSVMGSMSGASDSGHADHSGIDLAGRRGSALATGSDSNLPPSSPEAAGAAAEEAEVDNLLADLEQTPADTEEPAALVREEAEETVHEEEAAAARGREADRPGRPSWQRSPGLALAGGTVFGLILGIVGTRMIGGGGEAKTQNIPGPVASQQVQPKAATPNAWQVHLRNGDFDRAAEAGILQIQEDKPEELAARGSYRLGAYLQKTGLKVNPQDPPLKEAIADLQKAAEANNLDAIYELGLINELANKLPAAREEYNKGLKDAENEPVQKRRFQAALDRLEVKEALEAAGAAGVMLPGRPHGVEDRVAVLALLLIGLQDPQAQTQPQAAEDEAGYDFWQAAKLARQRKFADAIKAIDKARSIHDQRRFSRLRKAQNPLSDPTEDIFLRCCDELKAYWQMEDRLRGGGYLTNKNTPTQAVEALVQQAQSGGGAGVKAVADKLIMEKVISRPEDLSKGIDRLLADKKAADTKAADLAKQLQKATDESEDRAAKLKTALKERDDQLKTVADREQKLKAANQELDATLKKITEELVAAKLLDAPAERANVPGAVRTAIKLAAANDPQGQVRNLQNEIFRATTALKERWRPADLLPVWVRVLDQDRYSADLASKGLQDADRVKADSSATPTQKGLAQLVRGLALRNSGKFAEAKTVLESARTTLDRGEWLSAANAALKDVSDPAAYYAAQAALLYQHGHMDAALIVLGRAIPALPPKDQARLLAQRGLIELEAAQSKSRGRLSESEPLLTAARKDADEAAKAGVPEGHYAAGRIAEALGQWNAAAQSYRKALETHPALDADGSRYRMALARVLLQPNQRAGAWSGDHAPARGDRAPGPDAPPPAGGAKVGWSDPAPYPARTFSNLKHYVLMLVLGLQAPLQPGEQPDMAEAERLADEVLKAPEGSVPFNVRAQALAIKGRWTPALQLYIAGLRPLLPREYSDGLAFLIQNHPGLQRPTSLRVANPFEAEKYFSSGVNLYFDGDYADAEKDFLLAIENDGQDARYYYFLGLSRLAQNKRREAFRDFEEGSTLEQINRPAPAAVNESLERIQGPTRLLLNEVRERPER